MNTMESVITEATYLVAESRYNKYLLEDGQSVNTSEVKPSDNKDDNKPDQKPNNGLSGAVLGDHQKLKSTSVIPEDTQKQINFSKEDLKDIDKIKSIEADVKKHKNINMAKTIFRSTLSLGALAVGVFTAAPMALVSSVTIAINLLLNVHGNKKENELSNMQALLDKKNSEMQKAYIMERDPKKKAEMKEYMRAINTATFKVKAARGHK